MQLRENQILFIRNIGVSLRKFRKVCCQLATGGGKTVVFSSISSRYVEKSGNSVLILVHRKELLQQTRSTLYDMYGITAELIIAGTKYIPPAKVYIGMVESANKRVERLKNIGLVLIDESHIAVFNKMHFHFPTQMILGFTATPLSNNKRLPMKLYYETIVKGASIAELIADGFLCQNITRAPKNIVDKKEIVIKNGEYEEASMSAAFSKPKHIHNTVEVYKKWGLNKKTIIFNVNIEHSKQVEKAFTEAGFDCRHLDGEDNTGKRTKTLKWFKETPNAILCNVGILTAGFDEPTIEVVIINKSTLSMPLWLQMTGRGGRVIDEHFILKKQFQYPYHLNLKFVFSIIDMGGNALTHGDWCDERDWDDLFFNPPSISDKGGIAPVKSCPKCDGIISASANICKLNMPDETVCGYVFPEKIKSEEEIIEEFVIVTKNIDAAAIIQANRDKKEYYVFFKIGEFLAKEAKKTIAELNDEIANFIHQKYCEQGKIWAKQVSRNRIDDWDKIGDEPKKVIFSQWHQEKAKEHLFNELKKQFPKWNSPILASIAE